MWSKLRISPASLIAIIFLLAGGAQPAYQLFTSLLPSTKNEIPIASEDLEDSEETEDSSDSKGDGEHEVAKIVAKRMIIFSERDIVEQAFTAYLLVFKEHHPDVITPPPKG